MAVVGRAVGTILPRLDGLQDAEDILGKILPTSQHTPADMNNGDGWLENENQQAEVRKQHPTG